MLNDPRSPWAPTIVVLATTILAAVSPKVGEAQALGVQAFYGFGEDGGPTAGVFIKRENGHIIGIDTPWWLNEPEDLDWDRITVAYGFPTGPVTTSFLASLGNKSRTDRREGRYEPSTGFPEGLEWSDERSYEASDLGLGVGIRWRAMEVRAIRYGASKTLVQTGLTFAFRR